MLWLILQSTVNNILSEALLALGILAAIVIILKVVKSVLRLIAGIIINSVLGIVAIYLLDFAFNLGIPLTFPFLLPTAIFGLPAVGTIAILKILGVLVVA